jgi:hypothetical protein
MADRRPLVLVGGRRRELPAGDRVPAAGLPVNVEQIAGLSPLSGTALYYNGTSWALYTHTAGGRAISGVVGAADTAPYYTGSGAAASYALTPWARTWAGYTASAQAVAGLGLRETAAADVTLYVATTGSDTTGDGSAGNPYATRQRAVDRLKTMDGAGFAATIDVADGTYTGDNCDVTTLVGFTSLTFLGNPASPSSCFLKDFTTRAFSATSCATPVYLNGFKTESNVANAQSIRATDQPSFISFSNMEFGALSGTGAGRIHLDAISGTIRGDGAYTYSGGCSHFLRAIFPGSKVHLLSACTVSGAPSHTAFAAIADGGMLYMPAATFSGSATGKRFDIGLGGIVEGANNNANKLPGDTPGTIAPGGLYYTTTHAATTPTTGFALTLADGILTQILTPAGTLATGTITMPANPYDGQRVTLASTQQVTAVTHNPNTGQTLRGALTTIAADGHATWHYVSSTATWYRVE